jgi:hypothetical protein
MNRVLTEKINNHLIQMIGQYLLISKRKIKVNKLKFTKNIELYITFEENKGSYYESFEIDKGYFHNINRLFNHTYVWFGSPHNKWIHKYHLEL